MIKDYRVKRRIAVTDQLGNRRLVLESVEILDAGTFSDPDTEVEGLLDYCLDDSTVLNVIPGGFEDLSGNRYFPIEE